MVRTRKLSFVCMKLFFFVLNFLFNIIIRILSPFGTTYDKAFANNVNPDKTAHNDIQVLNFRCLFPTDSLI